MSNSLYSAEQYIKPFWLGDTVVNESVLPLADVNGTLSPIKLLYRAEEVISLRNARLDTLYTPEKDYTVEDGKLVLLPGGAIKTMRYDEYFFDKEQPGHCFSAQQGGYIYFAEGSDMHDRQLAVTYRHSDAWQGAYPQSKAALLPLTAAKLQSKQSTKILVFGDSISTGANSSAAVNAPPFADDWCKLTAFGLGKFYENKSITLVNKAVGGTMSAWGVENAHDAAKCAPDLAIIGFGMNDGSARILPETFGSNISRIMSKVREVSPNCEFILLATMTANPAVKGFFGLQEEYLPVLCEMERIGAAVADMTTFHKALLASKRYYDMSGNNVNHPNDFLARAYAQCLLAALGAVQAHPREKNCADWGGMRIT